MNELEQVTVSKKLYTLTDEVIGILEDLKVEDKEDYSAIVRAAVIHFKDAPKDDREIAYKKAFVPRPKSPGRPKSK